MGSNEQYIGMIGEQRSSSRVLKPPGGGHSNIFSPPDEIKPHARPAYNQQNSSNVNFCMNTVDPNEKVAKVTISNDDVNGSPIESDNAQSQSSEAPQVTHEPEAAKNAPLPNYHHHRSTALW